MHPSKHASPAPIPDQDALFCALVLVPHSYARNRFFQMFEQPAVKRVRRKAKRVRGIIKQLLGQGRQPAELIGEQVLEDRVLLRFQVEQLSYQRTTSLSLLEAALVHYALHKHRGSQMLTGDRLLVEKALSKLNEFAHSPSVSSSDFESDSNE